MAGTNNLGKNGLDNGGILPPSLYDADATDPDGSHLTYNLVLAPEGMTVNPTTGEITWTPGATKVLGNTVR